MYILAIDDAGFYPIAGQRSALLVAVTMDESLRVHDIRVGAIEVDGLDATVKVKQLVSGSRFKLDALLLPSVCLAGFNIVALKDTGRVLPTIAVNPRFPNMMAVEAALKKHFQDFAERMRILLQAGEPKKCSLFGVHCAVYRSGISTKSAVRLLSAFTRVGGTPEPLRVARLIARGLTLRRDA